MQVFKWVERKDTGRKAQALQHWKYFVEKRHMSDRAAVEIGKQYNASRHSLGHKRVPCR